MCIGMANGGKTLTEDLRKKSVAEAVKSFQEKPERFNNNFVETATERFVNAIKTEANREFAHRLKEFLDMYEHVACENCDGLPIVRYYINRLIEEMVGGME